jgi:hypothetical protein
MKLLCSAHKCADVIPTDFVPKTLGISRYFSPTAVRSAGVMPIAFYNLAAPSQEQVCRRLGRLTRAVNARIHSQKVSRAPILDTLPC